MSYVACILWTLLMAVWSAEDDAQEIEANEPINHRLQWVIRALGVGFVCAICDLWWFTIPMGALFSIVFRFTLNRLRDLDWRYVSPSSWYDSVFMYFAGVTDEGYVSPYTGPARFAQFYNTVDIFRAQVHRAGLLAYTAEVMVVVCSVIWMI